MAMISLHRIHRGDDAGFALPTAMFFILGMLAILSIGAVAAVNTQRGTTRDANSKSALAVAEAGVNAALLRYRDNQDELSEGTPCLGADLRATARTSPINFDGTKPVGGWCAGIAAPEGENAYTYWARPYMVGMERKLDVVSQATVDGVTRRILQTADIPPGEPGLSRMLGGENVVGIDFVDMSNNAQITGGVGSNGWVKMVGSANVCGTIRTGETPFTTDNSTSKNPPPDCPQGRTGSIGKVDFPPVTLPEGLTPETSATKRFFTQDGNDLPNWYLGSPPNWNGKWNNTTRELVVDSGLTLKLKGSTPYLVCKLTLRGGGTISMENPNGPVQIYIDAPENCPGTPTVPFQFDNGTKMVHNGYIPGIFILGSPTITTSVNPAGGAFAAGVVIYAPRTKFLIDNDFNMTGAVIAKEIKLAGGAKVVTINGINNYELPIPGEPMPGGIVKEQFAECRAEPVDNSAVVAGTVSPDSGC